MIMSVVAVTTVTALWSMAFGCLTYVTIKG